MSRCLTLFPRSRLEKCNTPENPGDDRGVDPSKMIVRYRFDSPRYVLAAKELTSEHFRSLEAGNLGALQRYKSLPRLHPDTARSYDELVTK
jgi:hypothetical protein